MNRIVEYYLNIESIEYYLNKIGICLDIFQHNIPSKQIRGNHVLCF